MLCVSSFYGNHDIQTIAICTVYCALSQGTIPCIPMLGEEVDLQ